MSTKPLLGLLAAVLLGYLGYRVLLPRLWSTETSAPISLESEPLQEPISPPERVTVTRGDRQFTIEKISSYEISGEVLSSTTYDMTWTSDFFDVDLGLIWGPRREEFKKHFTFGQMGRFLFWRAEGPVSATDAADLGRHLSNNHLIPAEGRRHLGSALRWMHQGDHVRLKGALVRVLDASGQTVASSSLSRDDTGDGACEVVWVDELQVGSRLFR